ncbi:unnamed protein product (macronuclear) [Paramecium tetraurelia]|uniref:Cwf15/Cwc15 cell cycle control protein n=1 Tax=Paramecium tetraurelia TaxID=5888 RepID=A0BCU2_PARTE|nr:uncharacterized protein GSPATT00004453001 [Paramecium tetraurelia]CAK56359.1 unnamed protein product [Paramecium tetraurelia]|eukprot:XP_001423757.1 hypothetical protein (macronuclear) [Paramecium tetraurelia strain d4-2]
MTTAHRPTYRPAIGGSEQGGNKMLVHSRSYHSKDLPAYLILKMRKPGQGTQEELEQKDFKMDLLKREEEGKRQRELKALGVSETSLAIEATQKNQNKDVQEPQILKKTKVEEKEIYPQDADDKEFIKSSDDEEENVQKPEKPTVQQQELKIEEDSSSSSSDEEDDDELLMREYQKIKEQREIEEKKKILEKQEYLEKNREEEIIKGNPLLVSEDYSLKKKWYEDTIFKNQSRLEVKEKQRFINDAVRSDFHRKFLNRYIQM